MPKFFCLQEAVEIAAMEMAGVCRLTSKTTNTAFACPYTRNTNCLLKEDQSLNTTCSMVESRHWINYLVKASVKLYQQKQDSKKERERRK